jgi:pyrimidine deaminase RibD-like protein
MHCHRPLKFEPCADALDAAKVADSTIAVNKDKAFMILTPLQSDWILLAGC